MGEVIDRLFQQWYQLAGAVMVAGVDPSVTIPSAETVVAESTASGDFRR